MPCTTRFVIFHSKLLQCTYRSAEAADLPICGLVAVRVVSEILVCASFQATLWYLTKTGGNPRCVQLPSDPLGS